MEKPAKRPSRFVRIDVVHLIRKSCNGTVVHLTPFLNVTDVAHYIMHVLSVRHDENMAFTAFVSFAYDSRERSERRGHLRRTRFTSVTIFFIDKRCMRTMHLCIVYAYKVWIRIDVSQFGRKKS